MLVFMQQNILSNNIIFLMKVSSRIRILTLFPGLSLLAHYLVSISFKAERKKKSKTIKKLTDDVFKRELKLLISLYLWLASPSIREMFQ